MNWDDIDVLHENNILIGSHCHDHALLHSNQTKNDIIKQLEISKKSLRINMVVAIFLLSKRIIQRYII